MKTSLLAFLFFYMGILLYLILYDGSINIEFKQEFVINTEDLKSVNTGINASDISWRFLQRLPSAFCAPR